MLFCKYIDIIITINSSKKVSHWDRMATDIYLKVDGVTGESADANHTEWIDVGYFNWGAEQTGSMDAGGGGGAGKVGFTDLMVVANMDRATPSLLQFCSSGKHIPEVKLSCCKAGGTQIEYATYILKDVIVTSVKTLGSAGLETSRLTYGFQSSKVEVHYWVQMADGGRGAETQMGWDVKANRSTI